MAFGDTGPTKNKHPWVSQRKHLKRVARREHGGRPAEWHGGKLYFANSSEEVPGVPHVPKPDRQAVGRAGALQERIPRESRARRTTADEGADYGSRPQGREDRYSQSGGRDIRSREGRGHW